MEEAIPAPDRLGKAAHQLMSGCSRSHGQVTADLDHFDVERVVHCDIADDRFDCPSPADGNPVRGLERFDQPTGRGEADEIEGGICPGQHHWFADAECGSQLVLQGMVSLQRVVDDEPHDPFPARRVE